MSENKNTSKSSQNNSNNNFFEPEIQFNNTSPSSSNNSTLLFPSNSSDTGDIQFSNQFYDNKNYDIFGKEISQDLQFGSNHSQSSNNDTNPAIKDMIYKLELAFQANKFDQEVANLYQQLTSLITTDKISQISSILNTSNLVNIRDKSLPFLHDQKNEQSLSDQQTLSDEKKLILSDQEIRSLQAEFLGSRTPIQQENQNVDEIMQSHFNKNFNQKL